jgi:hypothetical protein
VLAQFTMSHPRQRPVSAVHYRLQTNHYRLTTSRYVIEYTTKFTANCKLSLARNRLFRQS